jgi:1,2-phenylacetyl-CoA epoxidase catalytic subunit
MKEIDGIEAWEMLNQPRLLQSAYARLSRADSAAVADVKHIAILNDVVFALEAQ